MLSVHCNLLQRSTEINEENQVIVEFKEFLKSAPILDQTAQYLALCDDKDRLYLLLFLLAQHDMHHSNKVELS